MPQGTPPDSKAPGPHADGAPRAPIREVPPVSAVVAAVTGRTLPPPELSRRSKPTSVIDLVAAPPRGTGPIPRRQGRGRAELAGLAARARDAAASEDRAEERVASAALARALAARGVELDRAARLARRSLSLGDDPSLRGDLAAWLSSLGEPALAAATLRGLVTTTSAPAEKARTLVRLAVLLARAGDAEGAVDALTESAEVEPSEPMPRELLGVIASWSEGAVSAEEAARAFLDAADLRAERGESDAAFEDRLRAFELAPDLEEVADAVSGDLLAHGRGAAADEIWRASARAAPSQRAADIHFSRLQTAIAEGDVARALGAVLDGGFECVDDPALDDLVDEVFRRTGLEEVVAVRLLRRARTAPPSERVGLLLEVARLASTSLAQPELALEAHLDAFSLDPTNDTARAALRDRATRAGDHEPLVEGLLRVASRTDPATVELARNAARDLAAVAEEALGDAALALWALRRMEALGGHVGAAATARLAAGAARQAAELETAAREVATGTRRIEALRTVAARLRSRPDDRARLIESLASLVRASPEDSTGPLRLLERVLARAEPAATEAELQLFESVLQDRLASPSARGEAVRLRSILGHLLEARGALDEAAAQLAPLLDEAPGHPLGVVHVLLAATRAGRPAERATALLQLAEPQPPATRAVLLAVASEQLLAAGEGPAARDEARRAAEADPSSVRAASALAAAAGRDRDPFAAEILERRMGVVVPQSVLCAQLADALEQMGEEPLALAWTQRWVALAPGDRLAAGELLRRAGRAGTAEHLEGAVTRVMGRPGPLGELSFALADALTALGKVDPKLARTAARRALDVFGPRPAALREAALALADRDRDFDLATTILERWCASDPSVGTSVLFELSRRRAEGGDFAGAARDLRRAAEAQGDPEAVLAAATVLEAKAERAEGEGRPGLGPDGEVALADATARALMASGVRDGVLVAKALRNLGGALWDLAGDYRGAEQAFFAAAAYLPRHGLERYARDLWEYAGADEANRAVEERAATLDATDASGRATLFALLAMLFADEERYVEALPFALAAIEGDPSQAQAVAIVERCAHVEGGLQALDAAYDRLARAAMGKYGRRAAHYRAARQLERRGAPDLALDHAVAAFESVPEEGSTYLLLARLADTTGRAAQITTVLERVAEAAPVAERAGWLQKAAGLQERTLDGVRTRFDLLLRALRLSIEAEVLSGVGAAARELVAGGEPLELVALRFERAVAAALPKLEGEPGARAALVIADTALTSIGAPQLAADAILKAIVLGPEVPTFDDLVPSVGVLANDPLRAGALVETVVRAVIDTEDSDGFASALPPGPPLLRFALALAHALGDDVATNRLGIALAKAQANKTPVPEPPSPSAGSEPPPSLSRPLTSDGSWSTGPEVTPEVTPAPARPPGSAIPQARPSAPAFSRDSTRPAPSMSAPRSRPPSIEPPPLSVEAAALSLEQLEREAQQRGDHDAVAVFLARRIQSADSPETRRLLRLRRAAVLEQRLGRPEEACRELEKLVAEFPDDRSALPFLADLYARIGDAGRAAPLWDRMAARAGATDDERTEYGVRAVRAYLEAGNAIAAREAFARAATGAPAETVTELRAEIARASGDHEGIVASLDDLVASGSIEDPERLATLLVEAARAASASGDLSGALARARRAAKLDPESSDAVLEAARLDYRLRGGGTPREAQATIDDLTRIADELRPHHVELHAFLLAEMLDVVQGGGAGMRELTSRHAEIGSAPLLALGMAERLVRAKSYSSALPLFQRALEGDLGGLRSRARVLLAAADAAAHAGDASLALRLAEEAEAQPDGKLLAQKKRLEIVARHGPRPQAIGAAEELAASSSGAAKARALGLLARLFVDDDPDRAEGLYAEAIKHASGDRQLTGRLSEELEALRQGEPPPPSVVPVGVGELETDLAMMAAAAAAAATSVEEAAPVPSTPPALPPSIGNSEESFALLGMDAEPEEAARPAERLDRDDRHDRSRPLGISIAEAAAAQAAAAPAAISSSERVDRLEDLDLRLDLDVLPPSLRGPVEVVEAPPLAAPPPPLPSPPPPSPSPPPPAPAPPAAAPAVDDRGPTSSFPPPSRVVPPPPPSSRVVASGPAEAMFVERLHAGDAFAGDELIALWGEDAIEKRAPDVLAVRRRQLAIAVHRLELVREVHRAAKADANLAYARALEHVLQIAGSAPRGALPAMEPVQPPPPPNRSVAPEMVHALLYRDLVPPVIELLACLWETGIFRKDPAYYGLTGAERVSLGAATPLGRLLASLAPLFGQARPAHFLPGPEPPRVRPALLAQPAILVTGDPREDDPHLVFQLGATFAATLPEFAIVLGAPEFQVRQLLAATKVAFGPVPSGSDVSSTPPEVTKLAAELYQRTLPRTEKRIRLLFGPEVDLSFETARDVARLAARRAGLLACGDLSTALAFASAERGIDLAHASAPEGFEHAVTNVPEVADLVRLATRMEYAEARWAEGTGGARRAGPGRPGSPGIG